MKTRLVVEVLVGKSDKPESRWFEKTVGLDGILPLFRTVVVQLTECPEHAIRFAQMDEAVINLAGEEPELFLKFRRAIDLIAHQDPYLSCDAFFHASWGQCTSEPQALE